MCLEQAPNKDHLSTKTSINQVQPILELNIALENDHLKTYIIQIWSKMK